MHPYNVVRITGFTSFTDLPFWKLHLGLSEYFTAGLNKTQQKKICRHCQSLCSTLTCKKKCYCLNYRTLLASGRNLTKEAKDATTSMTIVTRDISISVVSTHSSRSSRESESGTCWKTTKSCCEGCGKNKKLQLYIKTDLFRWRETYSIAPLHHGSVHCLLRKN